MDPVAGAVAGAAAKVLGDDELRKTNAKLLERVLGPSADVLGIALGQWTEERVRNLGRIAAKAQRKSEGRSGRPNPRVANRILDDGSYSDDEIMAEYLSGVLAASRSEDGRDDRGLPWAAVVADLSSRQLRCHYLLYRQWATGLYGRSDLNLGMGDARQTATLEIPTFPFLFALGWDGQEDVGAVLAHCLSGLGRNDLIEQSFEWQSPATPDPDGWDHVVKVTMSFGGMELYGWAIGEGLTSAQAFTRFGETEADYGALPSLSQWRMPGLPPISTPDSLVGPGPEPSEG